MNGSPVKDYSMSLAHLMKVIDIEIEGDQRITDLCVDSRQLKAGAVFFAYPGSQSDGRNYIEQAQLAGASAIVYELSEYQLPEDITTPSFAVEGLRHKIGILADAFYQQPSADLQVFGITGTNGKTTCCYLLAQAFNQLGMQSAMIGTLGVGDLDALTSSGHTTPDAVSVHRLLAQWRDEGITQVCMEVSSHALDQCRTSGVRFYCVLFTNLSHDHLDYHGDLEQYRLAKQRLFTDYSSELLISNADDSMGADLVNIGVSDFIASYGLERGDVRCDEIRLTQTGMAFLIETNDIEFEVETSLIGEINIPNLLLVITTLLSLSIDVNDIKAIIKSLRPAPGRMELYTSKHSSGASPDLPSVVIDYAHTPDALEKALQSIRKHCEGQLWCVFGCGGDRDKAKRPVMGEIAMRLADQLIITNDNPRSEAPEMIAAEIMAGVDSKMINNAQIILDRAEAIKQSIESARKNDWVLVAGKGHETTQTIGGKIQNFSDRQEVQQNLGVAA